MAWSEFEFAQEFTSTWPTRDRRWWGEAQRLLGREESLQDADSRKFRWRAGGRQEDFRVSGSLYEDAHIAEPTSGWSCLIERE